MDRLLCNAPQEYSIVMIEDVESDRKTELIMYDVPGIGLAATFVSSGRT